MKVFRVNFRSEKEEADKLSVDQHKEFTKLVKFPINPNDLAKSLEQKKQQLLD